MSDELAPKSADGDAVAEPNTQAARSSTRWMAAIVGAVIVSFIALLAFAGGTSADDPSRLVGQRVPEVSGQTLAGDTFDIDNHRGQWVLINFFATWCPPCVAEHPDLVALDEWGTETGKLQVVSLVFNDEPAEVRSFFTERGGAWPVLTDPSLAITFQVSQVPESFLVNPDGVVVVHVPGSITEADVRNAIGA